MAGKAICRDTIKKSTIAAMKKIGTYRPEYDPIIDVYAEIREQYERLTKEFKKSGYKFDELTENGGTKKAPIVAVLENLRKDILQYSDRLCLNPKALADKKSSDDKKKEGSMLAKALSEIGG